MWGHKLPSSVPVLFDSLRLSSIGGYIVQCRRGVQSFHAFNPMTTDDILDSTSRGKRKHNHTHVANPAHQENNNSNDPSSQTDEPTAQSQWKPFHGRWQQQQPNRTKSNNKNNNKNNNNNTHISQQQKKNAKGKGKGKADVNANANIDTAADPPQPRRSRRVMKAQRKAEEDAQKEARRNAQDLKQLGQQLAPDTTADNSTVPFGDATSMGYAGSQGIVGPAAPVSPSSSQGYPFLQGHQSLHRLQSLQNPRLPLQFPPHLTSQPGSGLWSGNLQQTSAMSTNAGVEPAKKEEDAEVGDVDASSNIKQVDIVKEASHAKNQQPKRKAPTYPAPVPTASYIKHASKPPKEALDFMQPLLIILDLNGTLLHRTNKKMPPRFVKRPALDHFLDRVTARHMVMVWSSAQPATVETICRQIFTPVQYAKLVAIWNRTHLGLPEELYRNKVQVYKQLERVWADKKIQSQYPNSKHRCGKAIHHVIKYNSHAPLEYEMTGVNSLRWDQSNTVLIDDSRLKAAANPYNIFEVPEFTNKPDDDDELVLRALLERIKFIANSNDVSRCLRSWSEQGGEGITMDRGHILDIARDEMSHGPLIRSTNKKQLQAITRDLTKADEKTDDKVRHLIRREKKMGHRTLLKPTPPPMPLLRPEGEWEEKEGEKKAKIAGEKEGEFQDDVENTDSISSFLDSPELLSEESESEEKKKGKSKLTTSNKDQDD